MDAKQEWDALSIDEQVALREACRYPWVSIGWTVDGGFVSSEILASLIEKDFLEPEINGSCYATEDGRAVYAAANPPAEADALATATARIAELEAENRKLTWQLKTARNTTELHDAAYGLMHEDWLLLYKALAKHAPTVLDELKPLMHNKGQELDKVHLTVQSLRNRIGYLRRALNDVYQESGGTADLGEIAQQALERDDREYTAAQERAGQRKNIQIRE
jgi:hypothetical protein